MVKNLKDAADKHVASLLDSALANQVKDSAQQIWLAGMGAFSRAQAEGSKVFENLVKEGTSLQQKTQAVAGEKMAEASSKMSSMADDVQAKAGQSWDKLENFFEDGTAKALNKLGVPSAKDVDALMARIDALGAKIAKLSKSAPAKSAPGAAAKTPVKKATAKRAPARKANAA